MVRSLHSPIWLHWILTSPGTRFRLWYDDPQSDLCDWMTNTRPAQHQYQEGHAPVPE
jgi:hypothetical protein